MDSDHSYFWDWLDGWWSMIRQWDTGAATVEQGSATIVEDLIFENGILLNGTVIKSWGVNLNLSMNRIGLW